MYWLCLVRLVFVLPVAILDSTFSVWVKKIAGAGFVCISSQCEIIVMRSDLLFVVNDNSQPSSAQAAVKAA
eukprot:COSAG05_NODE_18197_length_312_cov_0.732394_1_plen_70_part_10